MLPVPHDELVSLRFAVKMTFRNKNTRFEAWTTVYIKELLMLLNIEKLSAVTNR